MVCQEEMVTQGEDITENLKTIKDIPHVIKSKIFLKKSILGEKFLFKIMILKKKNKFANPRNAASGS